MAEIPQNRVSVMGLSRRIAALEEELLPCERHVFVGRSEQLALLERSLERSKEAGQSVVIKAEAGMGKTRLVEEFAKRAEDRGAYVARGHCYAAAGASPYWPFQQIVEQLRGAGFSNVPKFAFYEATAVHPALEEHEGNPVERRGQFLTAIGEELARVAASRPLVVVIEDIQWADTGSLLLLASVVDRRTPGLASISTVRSDEPLESSCGRLLYSLEAKSTRLGLRGLTGPEVRELMSAVWGSGFSSEGETEYLRKFTKGNPLFTIELLRHLKDEEVLEYESIQQAIVRHRIPIWLAGLLDLRLDALPSPVRLILSTASVLGDEFSLDVLCSLRQEGPSVIADLLDTAIERGIVRPSAGLLESRFRFAHPLYRKRLHESLQPSLRRSLHGEVAKAAIAGEIELPIEDQASHAVLAGEKTLSGKANALCRIAAMGAERVYAYETAAGFWELAVESTSPRRQHERAELLAHLGWAHWAARQWTQARAAWKRAVAVYEALGESDRVGPLALALGETARWQQDTEEAQHWLTKALALLPVESEGRIRTLALLGSVACLRNEPGEGMALLEEARQRCSSRTDPYVLYWLSYGYVTLGQSEVARRIAEKAFAAACKRGESHAAAYLAASLAQLDLSLLRLPAAKKYVAFMTREAPPSDMMGLSSLLICRSLVAAYEGNWKRVVRICERTMGELRLAGRYQFAASRFFRAEAKLALGDHETACTEMSEVLPHLEHMRPAAALHLARALLFLDDIKEARRLVRRHAEELLGTRRMAAGRAILGEVAARVGERHIAEQVYRRLTAERRPLLMIYSPVSVQRVLGVIASCKEDWLKAIRHFETAIHQLMAGGALGELLQSHLDYADMRRARRRRGDLAKAQALELQAARLRDQLGIPHPASVNGGKPIDAVGACANLFALTGRELQVLRLVAEGRRNNEIAQALVISNRTVERHLENIVSKMGVRSRVEAVMRAVEEGLVGR